MHSVRITGEDSLLFPQFWQTYEDSFPLPERRSRASQRAAFADPVYRLDAWMDGTKFVGFMGWWEYGDFRYIEHLAVSATARSGGYGKKIMRRWMDSSSTPVYLEIEEVVDELTERRLGFYRRLGFEETPFTHLQPPYQTGEQPEEADPLSLIHI